MRINLSILIIIMKMEKILIIIQNIGTSKSKASFIIKLNKIFLKIKIIILMSKIT